MLWPPLSVFDLPCPKLVATTPERRVTSPRRIRQTGGWGMEGDGSHPIYNIDPYYFNLGIKHPPLSPIPPAERSDFLPNLTTLSANLGRNFRNNI